MFAVLDAITIAREIFWVAVFANVILIYQELVSGREFIDFGKSWENKS